MKSRWRKDLNVKNNKVVGKNTGKNFNTEVEKVFVNMSQNPEAIKSCYGNSTTFQSQKTWKKKLQFMS